MTKQVTRLLGCLLQLFWLTSPAFAQIDPELLKSFSKTQKEEKEVYQIGLSQILSLGLERATILKVESKDLERVRAEYHYLTGPNPLYWTNKAAKSQSGSIYISTVSSDSLPYIKNDITIMSSGLAQTFKWGGAYSLNYQRKSSASSAATLTDASQEISGFGDSTSFYTDSLIAEFTLPLLKGAGAVGYLEEDRGATKLTESTIKFKRAKKALLQEIAFAYWDLVTAQKNHQTQQEALGLAETFFAQNQARQKLGALDPVEVKQAEAQVALAKQNLLQAKSEKLLIEEKLKAILNIQDLPPYEASEVPSIKALPRDSRKFLIRALSKDLEIKLLHQAQELNQLDLVAAQDSSSSNLDLSLSYQKNGYGANTSEASSGINKQNAIDYQMAVTWQVPLFNYQGDKKKVSALITKEKIALQIENQKSITRVNVHSIWQNIELMEETIALAQIRLTLNQELFEKEEAKFKVGRSTSFRVSQIQQDLSNASLSVNQAWSNYEKAYLTLQLLTDDFVITHKLNK